MAYVAVRGGEQAIQRAEQLYRALNQPVNAAFVRSIERHLPYLVDRVMGEGSLYSPEMAALALAQTGGDLYESILLLRAYRSTLPRLAYAEPIDHAATLTVRRISAAFKDIPGGQILGPTLDYSHRILDTNLLDDQLADQSAELEAADRPAPAHYPQVSDWQRLNGLLAELPDAARDPIDPAQTARCYARTDPLSGPARASSAIVSARRYWRRTGARLCRHARLRPVASDGQ